MTSLAEWLRLQIAEDRAWVQLPLGRRRIVKSWVQRRMVARYPNNYIRPCGHRWCWRWANYQYRCPNHQDDE